MPFDALAAAKSALSAVRTLWTVVQAVGRRFNPPIRRALEAVTKNHPEYTEYTYWFKEWSRSGRLYQSMKEKYSPNADNLARNLLRDFHEFTGFSYWSESAKIEHFLLLTFEHFQLQWLGDSPSHHAFTTVQLQRRVDDALDTIKDAQRYLQHIDAIGQQVFEQSHTPITGEKIHSIDYTSIHGTELLLQAV